MSKNKVTLTVTVASRRLMPDEGQFIEWAQGQFERALELAERADDGTVVTVRAEFPVKQEERS